MGKTKTVLVGETAEEPKIKKEKKEKPKKGKVPGLKGGEKITMVAAEEPVKKEIAKEKEVEKAREAGPKARGTKYREAKAKVDSTKLYPLAKAVALVKETSTSSFDGTVEMHLVVKKSGINVNAKLPHSTGKQKKVELADEKTIEKLKAGKIDFDILLAKPEMMPKLVPFAKILGPKGLMPNPKNGTLIKSEAEKAKFSVDSINVKTEKKAPLIHVGIGKVSQKEQELVENAEAILAAIGWNQILRIFLSPTMGPSVKVEIG